MTKLPKIHRAIAQGFLAIAVLQFFLAGIGVFGARPHGDEKLMESSKFDAHAIVGSLLQLVALILLVLALIGVRNRLQLSGTLLVLMILQTVFAQIGKDAAAIGALHPLNGLAILAVAHLLTRPLAESAPAAAPATATGTAP